MEEEVQPKYISYDFKWKEKGLTWQSKKVVGHKYYEEANRMTLYKEDGGIFEIPSWNEHYSDLGADWADKVNKQYEAEQLAKETEEKEEPDEHKGSN